MSCVRRLLTSSFTLQRGISLLYRVGLLGCVFFAMGSAFAEESSLECARGYKGVLESLVAPPKRALVSELANLKTQNVWLMKDQVWGSKILPDSSTYLGRYAAALSKKGVMVIVSDEAASARGARAYFAPKFVWKSGSFSFLTHRDPAVILRKESLNLLEVGAPSIHGHEAFHAMGSRNSALNGKQIQYDGEIHLRKAQGLPVSVGAQDVKKVVTGEVLKGPVLQKYLESIYTELVEEELHAYVKNYVTDVFKAHHRETLQLIREKMKELPESLARGEKLKSIHLTRESVLVDQLTVQGNDMFIRYFAQNHATVLESLEHSLHEFSSGVGLRTKPGDGKHGISFETLKESWIFSNEDYHYKISNPPKNLKDEVNTIERQTIVLMRKSSPDLEKIHQLDIQLKHILDPYLVQVLKQRKENSLKILKHLDGITEQFNHLYQNERISAAEYIHLKESMTKLAGEVNTGGFDHFEKKSFVNDDDF